MIGGTRPIESLTDAELHHHGDQIRSQREYLENTEEAFGSEDLHNLRLLEAKIISEQGRRGMMEESHRMLARQAKRIAEDFIGHLHDIDKSRRHSPLFSNPDLGRARDLIEEAVEIVEMVVAGRGD
jgi:hypothetical protein